MNFTNTLDHPFTKSDGKAIVEQVSKYYNGRHIHDLELDLEEAVSGSGIGTDLRGVGPKAGNSLDTGIVRDGALSLVETKTKKITLPAKYPDPTHLPHHISSKGIRLSECSWAKTGVEAIEGIREQHRHIIKEAGATAPTWLLLFTHAELLDKQIFQVYVYNYSAILTHWLSVRSEWKGQGLYDRKTGVRMASFTKKGRTEIHMTGNAFGLFPHDHIVSGSVNRFSRRYLARKA